MAGLAKDGRGPHVIVDHSTLRSEISGTDFRYSVALVGGLDAAWCEAFRSLQADSSAFKRLRLDAAGRAVTFTCRGIEGARQVFDILERLDALVKLANRQIEDRS